MILCVPYARMHSNIYVCTCSFKLTIEPAVLLAAWTERERERERLQLLLLASPSSIHVIQANTL
jgi:hypothetical protein